MNAFQDFFTSALVLVAVGIFVGGFFEAIRKVVGDEKQQRRPWEGWQ